MKDPWSKNKERLMGIRNNLLGVGSVEITTETGIIIGAAVVKIVLVVHRIAW